MTKDLRQAILALTNAVKEVEGHALEGLRENVLELMPAGPILETLWAGLPIPISVMSGREGAGWEVRAFYHSCETADIVHQILAKPMLDYCELLAEQGRVRAAALNKQRIANEHELEKRLLAERDAFTLAEEKVPDVRCFISDEIKDALVCGISDTGGIEIVTQRIMDKIAEAATKPVHAVIEAVEEEAAGDEQA